MNFVTYSESIFKVEFVLNLIILLNELHAVSADTLEFNCEFIVISLSYLNDGFIEELGLVIGDAEFNLVFVISRHGLETLLLEVGEKLLKDLVGLLGCEEFSHLVNGTYVLFKGSSFCLLFLFIITSASGISSMASIDAYISVDSSLADETAGSVGLFLLLGKSLGLIFIVNALLSDGKFLLDFLESGDWAVVPRVSLHFSQCDSLCWIEL